MMAVDGNFHLSRNNKGGGSQTDHPFTGDWGFWTVQSEFDGYQKAVKGLKANDSEVRALFCDVQLNCMIS